MADHSAGARGGPEEHRSLFALLGLSTLLASGCGGLLSDDDEPGRAAQSMNAHHPAQDPFEVRAFIEIPGVPGQDYTVHAESLVFPCGTERQWDKWCAARQTRDVLYSRADKNLRRQIETIANGPGSCTISTSTLSLDELGLSDGTPPAEIPIPYVPPEGIVLVQRTNENLELSAPQFPATLFTSFKGVSMSPTVAGMARATLDHFYLTFKPDPERSVVLNVSAKDGHADSFEFVLKGSFIIDFKASVATAGTVGLSLMRALGSWTWIEATIPGTPIPVEIGMDIGVGAYGEITGKSQVSAGSKITTPVTLGVRYKNNSWQPIGELKLDLASTVTSASQPDGSYLCVYGYVAPYVYLFAPPKWLKQWIPQQLELNLGPWGILALYADQKTTQGKVERNVGAYGGIGVSAELPFFNLGGYAVNSLFDYQAPIESLLPPQ